MRISKKHAESRRKMILLSALAAGLILYAPLGERFPGPVSAASASENSPEETFESASVSENSPGASSESVSVSENSPDSAGEASASSIPSVLPARYSLVDQGKKPAVRSQGNTGTCWAISSVSAIESDLLPDRKLILSADHMSLSNGFRITQEDGGDYYMIMSYLSDWKGPVEEEEDPYGDGTSPEGLEAAVHVQEIRMFENMPQRAVKRMILQYGAVQSSLCLDRKRTDTDDFHYYNALTCAYFDPVMEELDHDILILGWDDTFSRDNFRIRPPGDGAWICQNTWGESFGEDGIFYVSYEDRNLLRRGGLFYSRIEDTDNYDSVYEIDTLGWQGRQGYDDNYECWFAGAFTAESEEELAAVGLYSTDSGTKCRVYVIPEFEGKHDLEKMSLPSLSPAAERTMDTAGFFTVDLDRPVSLKPGQQFAVVVWIETESETRPVAVEMVKDRYTQDVTLDGRKSWVSKDGKVWENTQRKYQTNVCLKAYTRHTDESAAAGEEHESG